MEPRTLLHLLTIAFALAAPVLFPPGAAARTLLSQKEALALAFPAGTHVERRTLYLTSEQAARAEKRGRVKIPSAVWTYYVGLASGSVTGYAYFDTHVVRTMPETVMAVLTPEGAVRSAELLAFAEPDDYLPRASWLAHLAGNKEPLDVFVGRAVRNITGASLTSSALSDALRRVLAVHEEAARP